MPPEKEPKQPRKFYRSILTTEVLSEDTPIMSGTPLEDIAYAITEGDCSGRTTVKSTEVTPQQMAKFLIGQGSDPEFFMLDESGNEIEE